MHPIEAFVHNPIKVAVAVLLMALFGVIAVFRMPMQLTPEVQIPTITIETGWPGASPEEVEREIIQEQEEQLKGVEGATKLTSESMDSMGSIQIEFLVGTDISEALLTVNSRLQQVPEYPEDADEPVIKTSGSSSSPIAWFILSSLLPDESRMQTFIERNPNLEEELQPVLATQNQGLAALRLRQLVQKNPAFQPLVPARVETEQLEQAAWQFPQLAESLDAIAREPDVPTQTAMMWDLIAEHPEIPGLKEYAPQPIRVEQERKFAEDVIEARFERVPGVANANVFGGLDPEMQVLVDPSLLAARQITISDLRNALRMQNKDTSGGDIEEGKRRWVVRTMGKYNTPEDVANTLVAVREGAPVYVRDVADVQLGYEKPQRVVRRFGTEAIAVNCERNTGANVLDVMEGLREAVQWLNQNELRQRGLMLTQVYDETEYIYSSVDLVNQNIILGGALTVVVLMLFLHLGERTLLVAPIILLTAVAALVFSPWIFVITLAVILAVGFWFARGALVVSLAIPTSIIGTFLLLNMMGRSLNVISLAGMAFAVGMLVDNAVVVLENVYRHYQMGQPPFQAAVTAAKEVWGAVVASTLTTIAVFLPVVFVQEEAGQLFLDIALAICCAVGLSLLVSVTVIPTASARLFRRHREPVAPPPAAANRGPRGKRGIAGSLEQFGEMWIDHVVGVNRWIQQSMVRRLAVVLGLVAASVAITFFLWPAVEYLPTGNRNLVFGFVLPPPGYNLEEKVKLGEIVEDELRPYWDYNPEDVPRLQAENPMYVPVQDFFFVVLDRRVLMGLRAADPERAGLMVPMVFQVTGKMPGQTPVFAQQASLFGRDLTSGRTIDVEITGPELEKLVAIGGQIMGQVGQKIQGEGGPARAFPVPSLDISQPQLHVVRKPVPASEMGVSASDLGYTIDALVDGAYATDYYIGGDKIDLVIKGKEEFATRTQDVAALPIATPIGRLVTVADVANVDPSRGPEQINHRERERAITIQVTPPADVPLTAAMEIIEKEIIAPIRASGQLSGGHQIYLSGTADKLTATWDALKWNVLLALLITYLLMAALFESWLYPLVVIVSVPLGAVGGIIGLQLLSVYLMFVLWQPPQMLDVLTMLGFIILIGTVVNNAILIVHQSLNHMREDHMAPNEAILESVRTRIRPIFMTTATTVCGLSPLVFFPGAGSELYRGLGAVVLGGLIVSTAFTLLLVPTLFSLAMELRAQMFGSEDQSDGANGDPKRILPPPTEVEPYAAPQTVETVAEPVIVEH